MSAKPATVPTWNTGGTNNVAPAAGKITTGWEVDENPASSYFNNRMKLYGEWMQYLSDGALSGAHTFADEVTIAHEDIRHDERTHNLALIGGENTNVSWNSAGYIVSSAAGTSYHRLDFEVGQRITYAYAAVYGNGSDQIKVRLMKYTTAGGTVEVANVTLATPAASWNDAEIDLTGSEETVAAGSTYFLLFEFSGNAQRASDCYVKYDRVTSS